jgi:hypothetical protein
VLPGVVRMNGERRRLRKRDARSEFHDRIGGKWCATARFRSPRADPCRTVDWIGWRADAASKVFERRTFVLQKCGSSSLCRVLIRGTAGVLSLTIG